MYTEIAALHCAGGASLCVGRNVAARVAGHEPPQHAAQVPEDTPPKRVLHVGRLRHPGLPGLRGAGRMLTLHSCPFDSHVRVLPLFQ